MTVLKLLSTGLGGLALIAGGAAPAASDMPADFYEGKNITMIIGTGAGGGYGLVSQMLARHMPKYIPGKPTIVLQYMPGGGGQKSHDYVYNVAPRDGYTICMPSDGIALAQRLRKVKYNAKEFNALGRMQRSPDVFAVMARTGIASLAEARKARSIAIAATAKSSVSYMNAQLTRELLGFPIKIVLGYRGTSSPLLAMEKGEVDGWVWVWPTIEQKKPTWVKDGTIRILAQVGLNRLPELPDVPLMQELTDNADDRALLRFMAAKVEIGRHHSSPPGFPKAQLDVLRKAYMETMKDAAFRAEADKRKLDLAPLSGEEVQKVYDTMIDAPESLVARMKQVLDYN
jgi:tripartite-type tricarboxylate transporter receptor subunit TctC